jgi:hypothetical protein
MSTIQHIKLAIEFAQDVQRAGYTKAGKTFKNYEKHLQWILKDFKTNPLFPDEVRQGIDKELNSDMFALEGLREKIPLIPADYRCDLEEAIDAILEGRQVKIMIYEHQG